MCFNAAELKAIQQQIQNNRKQMKGESASGDTLHKAQHSKTPKHYTQSNPATLADP
ncbi:hypothetical protein [Photobacterium halotolerans]|uniref:hypothetical protein n=1 Tax=Photobacterium halotolerans TaxID=265726 RepID=UPI001372B50E|nr:hypothetical protein [Photobacterium halotolerans]NAW86508.1 hypothetical protein [Photobacterium halotolerans]